MINVQSPAVLAPLCHTESQAIANWCTRHHNSHLGQKNSENVTISSYKLVHTKSRTSLFVSLLFASGWSQILYLISPFF